MPFDIPKLPSLFKTALNIPRGRQLKLYSLNETNIFETNSYKGYTKDSTGSLPILLLEDAISLEFSTSYSALVKPSGNVLGTLVSTSFTYGGKALSSGQFVQQGVKIWESTEAVSCNITAVLRMQNSGYYDVYLPALYLLKQTLPRKNTEGWGWGLIAPGPGLNTIFNLDAEIFKSGVTARQGIEALPGGLSFNENNNGVFNLEVENYIWLNKCLIEKAVPSWSEVLDEDGYPVSCSISLDFTTMEIATQDMIDGMITHSQKKVSEQNQETI